MIDPNYIVSYVLHPQFKPTVQRGEHFDSLQMCDHCRREVAGGEIPSFGGNAISIASRCGRKNGCVVCAFCGVAMLDLMAAGASQGVVPDCPKCGAIVYIRASEFRPSDDDDEGAEKAYAEWHRRMRCLELFAVAAGLSACIARESGALLDTEEIRQLFHSALIVTRLNEVDECINHFFDRLQDTITIVAQSFIPARTQLRAVELDDEVVPSPDDTTVGC